MASSIIGSEKIVPYREHYMRLNNELGVEQVRLVYSKGGSIYENSSTVIEHSEYEKALFQFHKDRRAARALNAEAGIDAGVVAQEEGVSLKKTVERHENQLSGRIMVINYQHPTRPQDHTRLRISSFTVKKSLVPFYANCVIS